MSRCYEHDFESVFCRNCGGYCGQACANCGTMTDGGEHTYVTMEWCRCDNQVFDVGFEEPVDSELFCSEHQCPKNLVDYDNGSRYECPECQRENGEALGLR
jgi:hypothetical protein